MASSDSGKDDEIGQDAERFSSRNQQLVEQVHVEQQQQQQHPQQSRYPRTLEGVLQMAVVNTPTGEAGERQRNEMGPVDAQRREFLEKAFSEMCKDEAKVMIEHLKTLSQKMDSEKDDDEEEVENALENLHDLCDGIDNAQDFHKVGGTQLLPQLMDHSRSEVRWRTFNLIATLVQNVPSNQKVLLEMGGVQKLLTAVDKDLSEAARIKALYAVSCLARENKDCQEVFVDSDGFSVLMRAMQSNVEKLQIKSAFMLQALSQDLTGFKETLHNMGMVHQLIGLLQTDHASTHEHFMLALLKLVRDHRGCIQDCRQPEVCFNEFLTAREELLNGKPEYQEEHSYCQELMKICFDSNHDNTTTLDR